MTLHLHKENELELKVLASSDRWLCCVQKAKELEYLIDSSIRAMLTKHCEKHNLTRKRERRLCCRQSKSFWLYLDNPELEEVIHDFFN